MEGDSLPSGARSSEKSFCGIYSLKNPSYLFQGGEFSYAALTYQYVCFAYYGDISDTLRVGYSYTHSETRAIVADTRNFDLIGLEDSMDGWTHHCYNIYERLQSCGLK
ncbi:unnamed protein product [Clavelina lepadiformis]|uniref:Uncharacterized protein n=1 Tax=Clavelina lepadiformis TaxID=159417 RepID=A0ABP0F4N2_CLALP